MGSCCGGEENGSNMTTGKKGAGRKPAARTDGKPAATTTPASTNKPAGTK